MLHHARAEYVELPGWSEDISGCRTEEDLPANARAYLDCIAEAVGVPVALVGVGAGREQVVWRGADHGGSAIAAADPAPGRRRAVRAA